MLMKLMLRSLSVITLSLSSIVVFASPQHLITHNKTTEESTAYIANVPSPYPTAAKGSRKVLWNLVRMACYGHTTGNKCSAVIKMASNTKHPIVLGTVTMDLDSGDITPKVLSANGYTATVTSLGTTIITKD